MAKRNGLKNGGEKQKSPSSSPASAKRRFGQAMDPSNFPPMWVDTMRVMFRKDAPVGILVFQTNYPDAQMSVEVARFFTTVNHIRRIAEVLKRNVDEYDRAMAEIQAKKKEEED